MFSTSPRRSIALEILEDRLTPAGLGLGLTLPQLPLLTALTNTEGHSSSSLPLFTAGHPGSSLGVDAWLISLHGSVGTASGLLSFGLKLYVPALPHVSLQTVVGSSGSLLSGGVRVDPLAPPPESSLDRDGHLPPTVSTDTPPVNGEVSVVLSPSPANLAPPTSPASLAPAGVAPVLVVFPTTLLGEGFRTNLTPNVFEALARSKDAPFGETHFLAENLNSIELSLPTRQQETAVSPAAYSSTDEMTDELFSLRDGALLENFGTAIGEGDSLDESLNLELHHGESDSAMSLWLLGILAGCVAGSAWLNRRKSPVALTPNLDPYSIPGR